MYCRKCGKSIPNDSVFCPYCGETVSIGTESSGLKKPEEKDHGFCSNCGAPLPPGKLTGLCDNCMEKAGVETSEYGRCENCGAPLDADDDGTLCKKCAEIIVSEHSPYQETVNSKRSHKGAIAGGIIVSAFAIIILAAIGNSKTDATQAVGPSSQIAADASSTTLANIAAPVVSSTSSSAASDSSTVSDLELLSSNGTFDSDINTIHITGKIKNNTKKILSYVEVQFALYDKSGSQVGTALANTNGLEPGNTWSYDAIGMAANVSTFKAINLSGY